MKSIITDPHPILHTRAAPVVAFDNSVTTLVSEMLDIMRGSKGMGLAGVQIGVPLRIAVIEIPADLRRKEQLEAQSLYILINPKIIKVSHDTSKDIEGCLSLPGIEVNVQRPTQVTVTSYTAHGEPQSVDARGLFARVIQHEIDHCNGILITDHGTPITHK